MEKKLKKPRKNKIGLGVPQIQKEFNTAVANDIRMLKRRTDQLAWVDIFFAIILLAAIGAIVILDK